VPGRVDTHEYVVSDDAGLLPNNGLLQTTNRGEVVQEFESKVTLDWTTDCLRQGIAGYKLPLRHVAAGPSALPRFEVVSGTRLQGARQLPPELT
jgi:hypothetical protein